MNYIYKLAVSLILLPLLGAVFAASRLARARKEAIEEGVFSDQSSGRKKDQEMTEAQAGSRVSTLFMVLFANVLYGVVEFAVILLKKFDGLPDLRMMKGIRIVSDKYMIILFAVGMLGLVVNIAGGFLLSKDIRGGALNQDAIGNHKYAMCMMKAAALDTTGILALCYVIVNLQQILA
ncbi:MAG: hypothetical protein K5744_04320 [Eubacterium sp.]|nr:hypothetical protein [Eubacterium sp.]